MGVGPFDDPNRFFEPWWPGAAAHVHVEAARLVIRTADLVDAGPAFPELARLASHMAAGEAVLKGTLMVLDDNGRPDSSLLRRRLLDSDTRPGEGALIVSDVLQAGDERTAELPFSVRRARLLAILSDGPHCVAGRGLRGEGLTLARAVADMGLDALSARSLDAPWRPGPAGDAWLRLPVTPSPAPERKPLLVLLRRLPLRTEGGLPAPGRLRGCRPPREREDGSASRARDTYTVKGGAIDDAGGRGRWTSSWWSGHSTGTKGPSPPWSRPGRAPARGRFRRRA